MITFKRSVQFPLSLLAASCTLNPGAIALLDAILYKYIISRRYNSFRLVTILVFYLNLFVSHLRLLSPEPQRPNWPPWKPEMLRTVGNLHPSPKNQARRSATNLNLRIQGVEPVGAETRRSWGRGRLRGRVWRKGAGVERPRKALVGSGPKIMKNKN